ncbi:unnamed protein product, partial [Nesidiocoris tenuis]
LERFRPYCPRAISNMSLPGARRKANLGRILPSNKRAPGGLLSTRDIMLEIAFEEARSYELYQEKRHHSLKLTQI